MSTDRSEGYEDIAARFIEVRSDSGATFVRSWACRNFPAASTIVDMGCGSGVPITQVLIEDGFTLFGIDASASLLAAFRRRFPTVECRCEAVQDSRFFNRTFDAAVAIGLLFLLSADDQRKAIERVAGALRPGGRFLFTVPRQQCEWRDVLTERRSISLGQPAYQRLLDVSGLRLIACHDEDNHFYEAIKAF
jgi:SAM-dependent methyltransferase